MMDARTMMALHAHRQEAVEMLQAKFKFSRARARKLVHGVLRDLYAGDYHEVQNPRRTLMRTVRRIAVKGRRK